MVAPTRRGTRRAPSPSCSRNSCLACARCAWPMVPCCRVVPTTRSPCRWRARPSCRRRLRWPASGTRGWCACSACFKPGVAVAVGARNLAGLWERRARSRRHAPGAVVRTRSRRRPPPRAVAVQDEPAAVAATEASTPATESAPKPVPVPDPEPVREPKEVTEAQPANAAPALRAPVRRVAGKPLKLRAATLKAPTKIKASAIKPKRGARSAVAGTDATIAA